MDGEPEHERNQSNNQIDVAEKKRKREDVKEENLQPRKTVSQTVP
jgi:hypothetical protein